MATIKHTESTADDLFGFQAALEHNKSVNVKKDGTWYVEGRFMRAIRWLLALHSRRLNNVATVFNHCLDQLEKEKTHLNDEAYRIKYENYVNVGNTLIGKLRSYRIHKLTVAANHVEARIIGLKYRAGLIQPKETGDEKLYASLKEAAKTWMNGRLLSDCDKLLKPIHKERLKELAKYTAYAQFILRDKHSLETCFKWILRTHNHAETLIQYPAMQQMLRVSYLASRIGYFNGDGLRVHEEDGQKELQMRFETEAASSTESDVSYEWISILDQSQEVTLRQGLTLTIHEIFKIFASKNQIWHKVEFFENGVCNWHAGKMARWDQTSGKYEPINLEKSNWWEAIPAMKWVSLEHMQQRYPELNLDEGRNWVGRNMGTRRTPTLEVFGTHAYRKIFIPTKRAGEAGYSIYTFGKFPTEESFPSLDWSKWRESVTFAGKTHPGEIGCPDPNIYNAQRQQGGLSFVMTPEEAQKIVMPNLRRDIQRGREGHMAYNLFVKNCAQWAKKWHKLFDDKRIPHDIFAVPMERSQPMFPVDKIFKLMNKLPFCVQNVLYKIIFFIVGGSQKKIIQFKRGDITVLREVGVLVPGRSPWRKAPKDSKNVNPRDKHKRNGYHIPAAEDRLWVTPGLD